MPLRALPKPALQVPANFELAFSVIRDGKVWEDGLTAFAGWLTTTFDPGFVPFYAIAEALDVHRIIANEWGRAVARCRQAEKLGIQLKTLWFNDTGAEGIEFLRRAKPVNVSVSHLLTEYDPWTMRQADTWIGDAKYADHFVDKFYDVFVDEYFVVERSARTRPDGGTFSSLELADHPRYKDAATLKKYLDQPPPIEWRETIDQCAYLVGF